MTDLKLPTRGDYLKLPSKNSRSKKDQVKIDRYPVRVNMHLVLNPSWTQFLDNIFLNFHEAVSQGFW